MYAQANHRERKAETRVESGPAEILEAVGALREHMRSMDEQVKELLNERSRLAAEVDRLSGHHGEPAWKPGSDRVSDPAWKAGADRVTDELDQLMRLYESTARRRPRPRSSSPAPSEAGGSDNGLWFKKMFMLLMLSDMV